MATAELPVSPLSAGDRLSRDEFLRLWQSHPEIKRAELLGGIVYMPSPVGYEHGVKHSDVGTWAGTYRAGTPGTVAGNESTVLLLGDAPQADVNLLILPECGGLSRREGKYLSGPAEFFAEVCHSSASYDLHQKLDLYEAARVPEYLAVLVVEREIRWHVLEGKAYQLIPAGADGIWRSRIFPGLWLDGQALLAGNLAQVLAKLAEGLATPEHKAFVEKLKAARR